MKFLTKLNLKLNIQIITIYFFNVNLLVAYFFALFFGGVINEELS